MLRLKIVQHTKRSMPGTSAFGGERNFELDSDALSMSNASESAMSSSNRSGSGRSQSSGFSETSKKSRRMQNAKKKMKSRSSRGEIGESAAEEGGAEGKGGKWMNHNLKFVRHFEDSLRHDASGLVTIDPEKYVSSF